MAPQHRFAGQRAAGICIRKCTRKNSLKGLIIGNEHKAQNTYQTLKFNMFCRPKTYQPNGYLCYAFSTVFEHGKDHYSFTFHNPNFKTDLAISE